MKTRFFVLAAAFLAAGLYSSQAQHDGTNATAPAPSVVKKPEEIQFKHPSFTFVRVRHSAGSRGQGSWATDFPEADRNFAVRFQKVTGLLSDTNVLELTDSRLKQQPFIYISEGGQLALKPEEVKALRDYLLNGGFLMVDDFWGEMEWQVLSAEFRKVFPDREPIELPLEHAIFNSFYAMREKPQVPSVAVARRGVTWERADGKEAHYRGLVDDSGRVMVIFCHNTDLADGWEEEATDRSYFEEFSQKKAYPMGINIVVYALSK